MNINISTFINPFKFFCTLKKDSEIVNISKSFESQDHCDKLKVSDDMHGRYVAVIWNNQWVRGVIRMEETLKIWLIDFGIFLRIDNKTRYVELPEEYKKYPTRVFEASIHGVSPTDKVVTELCEIENILSNKWNAGAIEKAKEIIKNACNIYFVPVAMLCTKKNDIILGDLYIEIEDHTIVNIVDELSMWPVFLERNKESYIENFSSYYKDSRLHHAYLLKPLFTEHNSTLPVIDFNMTLKKYNAICEKVPAFDHNLCCTTDAVAGSTYDHGKTNNNGTDEVLKKNYRLTETEIEKYSKMSWNINGQECNVLQVLSNKINDLKMCERYKNGDLKSLGRATTRLKFNQIYYRH